MTHDPVNHPKHYTSHPSGVECITVTEHMNFCIGNAMKYLWRADEKGSSLEDLKKARWYVDREIKRREAKREAFVEAAMAVPPLFNPNISVKSDGAAPVELRGLQPGDVVVPTWTTSKPMTGIVVDVVGNSILVDWGEGVDGIAKRAVYRDAAGLMLARDQKK